MLLGSARSSQFTANPTPDYSSTYGTYRGFFACSSTTSVAAYNITLSIVSTVSHGCGTVNHIRSRRIPGTSSQIVAISGSTATKFYRYTGTTFTLLATSTGAGRTADIAFDATNGFIYMVATVNISPYIRIYQGTLSDTITTATLQSSPAVLPAGLTQHLCFSPDGLKLAVTHATSPFLRLYQRSGATFTSTTVTAGTTAPSTTNRSFEISFNASSTALAWKVSSTQVRFINASGGSVATANITPIAIGFNPNIDFANLFLYNDNQNNDYYAIGYWNGSSLTTSTINTGITARQPYWSPDGLKVAIPIASGQHDLFNISPYYTPGSTQVGQLFVNRIVQDFVTSATGFDWIYY